MDGNEINLHIITHLTGSLDQMGIPVVHVEQVAAALQQEMRKEPMAFMAMLRGASE